MAIVVYQYGTYRKVKNLGWLLRHRADGIKRVHVYQPGSNGPLPVLEVEFLDGRHYICDFQDLRVLLYWVNRYLCRSGWVTQEDLTDVTRKLMAQQVHRTTQEE